MIRLHLILFVSALTIIQAFGQPSFLLRANKILPTDKQWKDLQEQYNSIPINELKLIEKELDSTISATDCYKFIHNEDNTKFIAFFMMRRANPKFKRLIHFGRSVYHHLRPSESDSILYLSYIVWGMKYEQNWYYYKDREDEFWDKTDESAKADFLFYALDDVEYFKKKTTEAFWKNGGATNYFRTLSSRTPYLKEYVGLPEIVGSHKVCQLRRQEDLLNEAVEKVTCDAQDALWNTLHRSDTSTFHSRYKSKYSESSCLVLYNRDRTKALLPMIYFDNKDQTWLTYYFLTINSAGLTLYRWKHFPTKRINREPGKETLETVYDLRTFIDNWNWGTLNVISNDSFWSNNFKDADLEPVTNVH